MYDGVFRKGYLEPYSRTLASRRSNLPKVKWHDDHNRGWTGEGGKGTGVDFDMIDD